MKFPETQLKYTSPRGKVILFDTFQDERAEYGGYWVDICPTCHNKYKSLLKGRFDPAGSGVASCSVVGCKNTNAFYYADFRSDEVEEVQIPA